MLPICCWCAPRDASGSSPSVPLLEPTARALLDNCSLKVSCSPSLAGFLAWFSVLLVWVLCWPSAPQAFPTSARTALPSASIGTYLLSPSPFRCLRAFFLDFFPRPTPRERTSTPLGRGEVTA